MTTATEAAKDRIKNSELLPHVKEAATTLENTPDNVELLADLLEGAATITESITNSGPDPAAIDWQLLAADFIGEYSEVEAAKRLKRHIKEVMGDQ